MSSVGMTSRVAGNQITPSVMSHVNNRDVGSHQQGVDEVGHLFSVTSLITSFGDIRDEVSVTNRE